MPQIFATPEPDPNLNTGTPVIHSAQWLADGVTVQLSVTLTGGVAPQIYVLNATDPYGASPELRTILQTMVDDDAIVIEAADPALEDPQP